MPIYFTCALCKKRPVSVKCEDCDKVGLATWYCSEDHREKHNDIHVSTACRPFATQKNVLYGKYLSASRDIRQGELIIKEKPLLTGPKSGTKPVCLSCYSSVNGSYRCSRCRWPMCNIMCEKNIAHVPECSMVDRKIGMAIVNCAVEHPFYSYITPLRCLYMKKWFPNKYLAIKKLESLMEIRQLEGHHTIAKEMKERFNLSKFTDEEVKHVCGLVKVNAFGLARTSVHGIYEKSSLFAHSCVPNAYTDFNTYEDIVVRASVDINKGDTIYISYVSQTNGTYQRQAWLLKEKYFNCGCPRCIDPTELGSYCNSHMCSKCKIGRMIPPIVASRWKCDACDAEEDGKEISVMLNAHIAETQKMTKLAEYDKFLKNNSSKFSKHHYIISDVQVRFCCLLERPCVYLPHVHAARMSAKFKITGHIMELMEILFKGYNKHRGTIMTIRMRILVEKIKTLCNMKANERRIKEELLKALDYAHVVVRSILLPNSLCPRERKIYQETVDITRMIANQRNKIEEFDEYQKIIDEMETVD